MKALKVALSLLLGVILVFVASSARSQAAGQRGGGPGVKPVSQTDELDPMMRGVHWARGAAHSKPSRNSSPDMTWHKGAIMPTAYAQAIFWGTSWGTYAGDKISGTDSWYDGVGGSPYARTSDEYTGSGGQQVTSGITYGGHTVDTSSVPSTVSKFTTPTQAEVCKVVGNNAVSNGYYAVYVDVPRGHAGFCAYHSYGSCNNTPVQYAFFFNLDGDTGCDPESTVAGQSQGLAALANVSGHELSEARSDPRNGGWYDSSGAENGDKCAWTFGSESVAFSNGTEWKIQGNWSNYAYDHNIGYPNFNGQHGCLDGGTQYGPIAPAPSPMPLPLPPGLHLPRSR